MLGFFVDIAGMKNLLEQNENKALFFLNDLANDLYKLGLYSSDSNKGGFLMYQMGDGFMVHFDNTKEHAKSENCFGTAEDMISFGVALAQNFIVNRGGILHIGFAKGSFSSTSEECFDFAIPANSNSGNGWRCGRGVIFPLPVQGTLLARAYSAIAVKIDAARYEPKIVIDNSLLSSLSMEMKSACKEISHDSRKVYLKSIKLNEQGRELYQDVFRAEISQEKIDCAIDKYNRLYPRRSK